MNEEVKINKRGRKPGKRQESQVDKEQSKFFVDLSKEQSVLESIMMLIREANKKSLGREITFKDLVIYALPKLTIKDLERIQDNTLSSMERVQKALIEYNQKHSTNLDLGEFLVKKMNLLKEA